VEAVLHGDPRFSAMAAAAAARLAGEAEAPPAA
jgi:hypothetical protein